MQIRSNLDCRPCLEFHVRYLQKRNKRPVHNYELSFSSSNRVPFFRVRVVNVSITLTSLVRLMFCLNATLFADTFKCYII